MPQKTLLLLILAGLTTASGLSQSWGLRGPALGLDYNPEARTLRPILGVPGASSLGAPLTVGIPYANAYVPPGGRFAIVDSSTSPGLFLFAPGAKDLAPLPDLPAKPDLVAFSPQASSAALYFQESGQLFTIAGLPDQPQILQRMDTSNLPGPIAALAVNDSGTLLLAALAQDAGGGVFLLTPEGNSRNLIPSATAASLAFLPDRSDALVLTSAPGEVYLATDLNGAEQIRLLIAVAPDAEALTGAALSPDGNFLMTATAAGSVTLTNLADQSSRTITCPCQPDGMVRLGGAALFRLTAGAAGPIWILDATDAEPRIVFVPRNEEE